MTQSAVSTPSVVTPSLKSFEPSFNWDVVESEIFDANGNPIKGYKHLSRSDNGQLLNICKSSYTVTPNAFFEDMLRQLGEIGEMEYIGVGDVDGGKKVVGYLKGNNVKFGDFETKNYLIMGNAHDGNASLFVGTTNFMFRCKNQFTPNNMKIRFPHFSGHIAKAEDMVAQWKKYKEKEQLFNAKMQKMATVKIDQRIREQMIGQVMELELGKTERLGDRIDAQRGDAQRGDAQLIKGRKLNLINDLQASIDTEMADLGHNVLGLMGGVTHWTTHKLKAKHKVFGLPEGTAAKYNQKAMNFALELIK